MKRYLILLFAFSSLLSTYTDAAVDRPAALSRAAGTYKVELRGYLRPNASTAEFVTSKGTLFVPDAKGVIRLKLRLKGEPITIKARILRATVRNGGRYIRYRAKTKIPDSVPHLGGMQGSFPLIMHLKRNREQPYISLNLTGPGESSLGSQVRLR